MQQLALQIKEELHLVIKSKQNAFRKNRYNARFIEGKYEKLHPHYKDHHKPGCNQGTWEQYWDIRKQVLRDKDKIIEAPSTCLIHKLSEKGELCDKCNWLRFGFDYKKQIPGIRYQRRQAPMFMYENMHFGKCWCGKAKDQWQEFQRKYCCGKHADCWYFRIECYWPSFRHMICIRDKGICQECKRQVVKFHKTTFMNNFYFNGRDLVEWDADHIQAIALGGMCFDSHNVRTLCNHCHKNKTASDMKIIAWWKAVDKYYDVSFKVEKHITLEVFCK